MKLTTKIIFGIILSIFAVSLIFIIGFSFSDRIHYQHRIISNKISISQDNPIGLDINPFNVVVIEDDMKFGQVDVISSSSDECSLTLYPISSGKENKLFFPEALYSCIDAKTNDDTLKIIINFDELRKKYNVINHEYFSGINFNLFTSRVNIINNVARFCIKVENIETDSIKIVSSGDILIESCKAIIIEPVMDNSRRKLDVKNSVAKEIHLDLDGLRNWNLEECNIEIQNLTGSGRHNITLDRNKAGKINWYPKDEDAELNIKVQGDTAQIVFQ